MQTRDLAMFGVLAIFGDSSGPLYKDSEKKRPLLLDGDAERYFSPSVAFICTFSKRFKNKDEN